MKFQNYVPILGILAAIVIIGAGILLFSGGLQPQPGPSQEVAVKRLSEAYTVLGAPVEVLSVKEESGIYRVLLRAVNTTTLQEVFISKDGSLLLRNVERLQDFTSRVLKEDNFSQCLLSKGVVVFGSSSDLNTLQQLQELGSFSSRIFFDCSRSLQTCINLNITSVPATAYQNQVYYGVQPGSFYTQLTGCSI